MNNSYTLQQIILGLRNEYLNHKKNMAKLNSLLNYDKLEFESLALFIYKLQVYCKYSLVNKDNYLLNKIKEILGKKESSKISIVELEECLRLVYIKKELEFKKIMSYILNTEFCKNIDQNIVFSNNDDLMDIKFGTSSLHYRLFDSYNQAKLDDLYYNPSKDSLIVKNRYNNVTIDQLKSALALNVNTNLLNEYTVNTIKASRIKNKKLILPDEIKNPSRRLTFKFQKNKNGISLSEKQFK